MKSGILGVWRWFNEAGWLFLVHLFFLSLGLFMHIGERTHQPLPMIFQLTNSPINIAYSLSIFVFPPFALLLIVFKRRRLSHFVAHIGMSIAQFVAMIPSWQ